MPELPEVETIRRSLEPQIIGQRIEDVELIWDGAVVGCRGKSFREWVTGKTIEGMGRKGKYLMIHLDQGVTILAHMRMTGKLLYFSHTVEPARHTHVVMRLTKGELHFNDQRKFGRLEILLFEQIENHPSLAKLGPEPLSPDLSSSLLYDKFMKKKVNLKGVLLDQTVVAGLGNIYADEVMFRAQILPQRLACQLSLEEIERVHFAMREIIQKAIEAKGTTFRDYRDGNGNSGSFQHLLKVYNRGGLPCVRCGTTLERGKLAGRTTVWCPNCQH